MSTITAARISEAISELCLQAHWHLRRDVARCLKKALRRETNARARRLLQAIIDNAATAQRRKLAICQDTGLPAVFVELGQQARIRGDLNRAIQAGIRAGYTKGSFRHSIVKDPLLRGEPGVLPAVIHIDIVPGSRVKLTVLPKGFGCENKTQLKMFLPTASLQEIEAFIVDTVRAAGPDACPPYVIGVGLGGTAEAACLMAKKALLKDIAAPDKKLAGHLSALSGRLEKKIDALKIGPMGLGGRTTALAVRIEAGPTHIAGLPVAVSVSCHALRSATKTLV
ncbi:MAG TPA: fumarate hydratase [Candidatus Omnitrophota bacterium]|nr:fumarate hydratase [Candidatus Omnitrophota bacterium]